VIEAESQAVLNILTEHDFQDAFTIWQKRWERCIRAEGDYFKGDGGQYFGPGGSISPGNYGRVFIFPVYYELY
jgi:hypothetical protein